MRSPTATRNNWFVSYPPRSEPRCRLFGIPQAGTGPAVFHRWHRHLPSSVEVCGVQLPGRGGRIREPLFRSMGSLVDALLEEICPFLDRPYVIFGHSLGALTAFELCRRIEANPSLRFPGHLYAAACRAPHQPIFATPSYNMNNADFAERIRRTRAVPDTIWERPKLIEMFLAVLRADAEVGETFCWQEKKSLTCPVTAIFGQQDAEVTEIDSVHWAEHTRGPFACSGVPGNHFFVNTPPPELFSLLSQGLQPVCGCGRSSRD